jgi:predicted enzyme related to lactoylglutathione lyase
MAQATLPVTGTFCWPELSTTDLKAAQAFYGDLLDWRTSEFSTPVGSYIIFTSDERQAAGLCAQNEEQRKHGVPPNWLSYVSVASADASAAKAKELGAQILTGPFDVMEEGRMAVLQDPGGAVFALWQPKNHKGASAYGEPGALCWTELATKDAKAAQSFYTRLFGWTAKPPSDPAMPYFEWVHEGAHFGGMMEISEHWGPGWKEIPSHWMVYFMVKDVDERTARAQALGATVRVPPSDIPKVGRFAVLADPQGAVFSLFQGQL